MIGDYVASRHKIRLKNGLRDFSDLNRYGLLSSYAILPKGSFKKMKPIRPFKYNDRKIPYTNSTPFNSEKELLYMKATGIVRRIYA